MFASEGEIFLKIGNFSIYYYGIFMALALCVGVFVSIWIAKKEGFDAQRIYDISPFVIIGGIVGARLYYCMLNFLYYVGHPLEIIQIWQGGISIHGALIGGLIAVAVYAKKYKLPLLKLCDIFSYGVILAQAVGRWGNFFNSEAFGRPCELPWKLFIPISKRPLELIQYEYFHPTFLYEMVWNIFVFLILYFAIRTITKKPDGIVFCAYLILYSIGRLIIEGVRVDSALNIGAIPIAQIISVLMILVASITAILVYKRQAR